jgi:hypothetical protein
MPMNFVLPYSIELFCVEPGRGPAGYGPSIVMADYMVEAILALPNKLDLKDPFYTALVEHVAKSAPGPKSGAGWLEFLDDTWLLTTVTIGGGSNRPSCGLMGSTKSELSEGGVGNIRYQPFNIDHMDQSAAILSTWLMWFDGVIRWTPYQPPYAPNRSS